MCGRSCGSSSHGSGYTNDDLMEGLPLGDLENGSKCRWLDLALLFLVEFDEVIDVYVTVELSLRLNLK